MTSQSLSNFGIDTPYKVGSVLWRLFSTLEVAQYIGDCSVHRRDNISTVGDSFSTVGDSFSTVEGIQYIGGAGTFSTCGGITSVL